MVDGSTAEECENADTVEGRCICPLFDSSCFMILQSCHVNCFMGLLVHFWPAICQYIFVRNLLWFAYPVVLLYLKTNT